MVVGGESPQQGSRRFDFDAFERDTSEIIAEQDELKLASDALIKRINADFDRIEEIHDPLPGEIGGVAILGYQA